MKALLSHLRVRLRAMVGVDEEPARLAAAWALGIGLGLSPFLGIHSLIALLLAFAFRLKKLDVLLGTLIANPWTLAFYFPFAVLLGKWITGVHIPHVVLPALADMLHAAVWRGNARWVRAILLAWGVGASIIALPVGLATYFILKRAIVHHRRRHRRHRRRGFRRKTAVPVQEQQGAREPGGGGQNP